MTKTDAPHPGCRVPLSVDGEGLWTTFRLSRTSVALSLLGLLLVLLIGACGSDSSPSGATATPDPRAALSITTHGGASVKLRIEIAQTGEQTNVGLSNRKSLDPNGGMLFVLPVRGPGFWMKDTSIPLSVAFISKCGDIVALADMQPFSEELHNTQLDYRFGLEVNQGWFGRNGSAVGDKVSLPEALRQAGC